MSARDLAATVREALQQLVAPTKAYAALAALEKQAADAQAEPQERVPLGQRSSLQGGMVTAARDLAATVPSESELRAIAIALDELEAYRSTVGEADESHQVQAWASVVLRRYLDRVAENEHLAAAANRHGGVVRVDPVRFTFRRGTPPSGPKP